MTGNWWPGETVSYRTEKLEISDLRVEQTILEFARAAPRARSTALSSPVRHPARCFLQPALCFTVLVADEEGVTAIF